MRGTYGGNNGFNQDDYSMITDHKKLIDFDKQKQLQVAKNHSLNVNKKTF